MRIAIDIREFRKGRVTGTARILKSIAPLLFSNTNNQYILFANQFTDTGSFNYPNVRIIQKKEVFTLFYDQVVLPSLLKKEQADIFISFYFKCPLKKVCNYIVFIHDLHFLKPILRRGWERLKPYGLFLGSAVGVSDKIITGSNFSKNEIINILKVATSKVEVIPYPLDKNFTCQSNDSKRGEAVNKYGIRNEYFLYIGNFYPHKNVGSLIKAYSNLAKDIINKYSLILVGKKDNYFKKVLVLIKNLNLEDRVKIIDFIEEEDLAPIYKGAALFIYPSLYEGFGYPPLEALTQGTKVLSSDRTSLPEVLKDCAFYFNPQDQESIKEAITHALEAHSKDSRELLLSYGPEKFLDSLQTVINSLNQRK